MMTLYGMQDSGNCYKPRLLMALTGRAFRHRDTSWLTGETTSPEFLRRNPIGKVPLLELEDGRTLPESNAILVFLGENTRFWPADAFERARMFAWMFFEQYSHEPNVAVRRSLLIYPQMAERATPERLEHTRVGGEKALGVMNDALAATSFLLGNEPSLADIALYAYTHNAADGGFDLDRFPAVAKWLKRIEALEGFRPMTWLPDTSG